jgi:hypothetical protein
VVHNWLKEFIEIVLLKLLFLLLVWTISAFFALGGPPIGSWQASPCWHLSQPKDDVKKEMSTSYHSRRTFDLLFARASPQQ